MSAPQQQPAVEPEEHPDWKQQLAERLDAYRAKRPEESTPSLVIARTEGTSRASRIARAVASRYASAPSYSEVVEQAAEQEARAAHEKRMQEAAAAGQQPLPLEELIAPPIERELEADGTLVLTENELAGQSAAQAGIPVLPQFLRTSEMHVQQRAPEPEPSLEELWASALVEPRAGLPSKLIEFPREFVSAKRARPKDPEPPVSVAPPELLDDPAQLRIFEVANEATRAEPQSPDGALENIEAEPGQASAQSFTAHPPPAEPPQGPISYPVRHAGGTAAGASREPKSGAVRPPTPAEDVPAAVSRTYRNLEWAAISLDREPHSLHGRGDARAAEHVPFLVNPASIDRRLMAFAVDFALVTAAFLAFLLIFAASTPHLPTGATAALLSAVVYGALWFLYQVLFFSLGGATAGMLYARIALCTFDDQNPTRKALRRRIAAWWLSCLPVGLGFLWCFVDEDNLSWHDRMTRMYQREY